MNSKPLKDFTIVDLTTRLPGPLAASLLKNQGAKILKLKNLNTDDPFRSSPDKIFNFWHKQFTIDNEIFDECDLEKKIALSNGALVTWQHSQAIGKLCSTLKKPFVLINIKASRDPNKRSLHDINALSDSKLLQWHLNQFNDDEKIIPPPLLPIAGIQFANTIALTFCSTMIKAQKTQSLEIAEVYLDESIDELSMLLKPREAKVKSLHTGLYPCYQIYQLKEKSDYLIIGAIEAKFWDQFISFLGLNELLDKQFDASGETTLRISGKLKIMKREDFNSIGLIGNCLSFFSKADK